VTPTATNSQPEVVVEPDSRGDFEPIEDPRIGREQRIARFRTLWAERRFLFRVTVAALLASILIAFLIPNRYESTVQLMPPDSHSGEGLSLLAGLAGGSKQADNLGFLAGDLLGMKTTGALFVGVLKSRTALDRIVDRYDLKKVYGEKLELKAREKLVDRTEISEERKSGIIRVTVTDRDPKRAAAIAGSYVDELDTLMAQLTTSSAHRERVFLEQRLAGVNRDLETAEKEFSQFASKNATLDITEQGKAMVMAAATLEGQLIAAQSELEGLKQIYTDSNVRVRSIEARISELRKQLQKIGGKAGEAPPGDGESTSDLPYPSLRQLPVLGVPFADKFRQLKVQEVVFETLTKQYEIAKVQEAKEIPTVKVLDRPEVPERKSFPPRLLLTVLGTCVAFLAGCVWLFARRHWDAMDPEDPGKQLAIDVATAVRAEALRLAPAGGMLRSMAGKPETKNGSETTEEEAVRKKATVKPGESASPEPRLSRATGRGL
jgi:uncharacterized protein involved in exopolysaccharide biosynthesis